jgi:hypothetical protein
MRMRRQIYKDAPDAKLLSAVRESTRTNIIAKITPSGVIFILKARCVIAYNHYRCINNRHAMAKGMDKRKEKKKPKKEKNKKK